MSVGGRPSIHVNFRNSALTCLVDTGACCSLMQHQTYLKLHKPFPIQPSPSELIGINGQKIKNMGCGYFKLNDSKEPIFVYLVPELGYDLLLGNDTLWAAKAKLDFRSPFMTLWGRPYRFIESSKHLPKHKFGNRLDNLAKALQEARNNTFESRKYNRQRLEKRANVGKLSVGDTVILKANVKITLTARWDPVYIIIRARHPVYTIQSQTTGKIKVVNRDKLTLVDPHIDWDEVPPRPKVNRRPPMQQMPAPDNNIYVEQAPPVVQDNLLNNEPSTSNNVEQSTYHSTPEEVDMKNMPDTSSSIGSESDIADKETNLSDSEGTDMSVDISENRPDNNSYKQKSNKRARQSTSSDSADDVFLGTDSALYRPADKRRIDESTYTRRLRSKVNPVQYYGYNNK